MSGDPTYFGGAIDQVDTSPIVALGTERVEYHATLGRRVWRYVLNGEAATNFTVGLGVMIEDAAPSYTGNLSGAATAASRMLGVAQHTIAFGSYGWILREGFGEGVSNGSTTANTEQMAVASGQFADATIGTNEIVSFAIETEDPAGAGGFFTMRVAIP